MATVFLARLGGAGGFQRLVAIKRLHPHLAKDAEFVQMFLDEARLAARLHHPHVVPILEIGESQGYYLVMEYVEGDTLAHLLARSAQAGKAVPARVSVRVAIDTLAGLHVAHELLDDEGRPLEIVHRDVSPQNILIGVDGTAKITDFGVARAASRLTTTRSGQLKGKLSYMAPEQARGKAIDRRADLFAMGIVVWEMLAQKRLFKGEGEADTLEKVLNAPIPDLAKVAPHIPEALAKVVMKTLDRSPDARFATCAEMSDALEQAARDANLLGSHKDVAEQLQAVIGTDISQQREAVRAWLARSEPSRSGISRPSVPQPSPSNPSSPSSPSRPSRPASDSATRVEAGRASRGALADGRDARDPTVSSVSSAAISVGQSSSPGSIARSPEGPKSRRVVWIGAISFVLVGVLATAGFLLRGRDHGGAQASQSDAVPTSAPPTPASAEKTVASAAAPATPPSAVVPSDPSGATVSVDALPTASPSSSAAPHAKPHGATHGTHRTGPATTAPQLPDDMSKNPYR